MGSRKVKNLRSCKGQVAIFVIIAVIIVGIIIGFFLLIQKTDIKINAQQEPQRFFALCLQDSAQDLISNISKQGGLLEPSSYLIINETKVAYLCYTPDFERICSNTEPMLVEYMQEQLREKLNDDVEMCFDSLKESLKPYDTEFDVTSFNVFIENKRVLLDIKKRVKITREEESKEVGDFSVVIQSPLYDFALISNEIILDEINCNCGNELCNADIFKISDSRFVVERFVTGDNEKIYTIRERSSGKEFNFAVRNCVKMPTF